MPSWYLAFDRARAGQQLGGGRALRRSVVNVTAACAAFVVGWCALVLLLTSLFSSAARTAAGTQFWVGMSTTLAKAVAVRPAQAYRSTIDSTVTPSAAGALIANLMRVIPTRNESSAVSPGAAVAHWFPPVPAPALFGPAARDREWTTDAILVAAKGLTIAQRAHLVSAAAYPSNPEFSLAASAPGIDLAAGRWTRPLPAGMHPYELSIGRPDAVRAAAESHAALAALDISAGRPADAEQHAREIVSVGSALLEGPTMVDVLVGIRMLRLGIATLEAVYRVTGQDGKAHELFDAMLNGETEMVLGRLPADGAGVRAAMYDIRLPRAIRLQMLPAALFQACADPDQLLFGLSREDRRLRRYAADSLVRYSSEREAIALLDGMATGTPRESGGEYRTAGLAKVARLVDVVIGGHRFESCASYYMRRRVALP